MNGDETVIGVGGDTRWALPAGTMLDNYRVEGLMGRGAMGEVYEVEQVRLGRRYALKLLPAELNSDVAFRSRFEQEARTLATLEHPNIVQIVYAGEDVVTTSTGVSMPCAYLVMELLQPFESKVIQMEPVARGHLIALLEGLEYAHSKGVVHRDLKPANLLMTQEGRLKISDFGVARLLGDNFMHTLVQRTVAQSQLGDMATVVGGSRVTGSTSSYVGTIHYMAPEVISGGEADARSDLYAVGVIAYEWLTGRKPIGRAKAVCKVRPELHSGWDDWVDRLLEYEPVDRFQSAREAMEILRNLRSPSAKGIPPKRKVSPKVSPPPFAPPKATPSSRSAPIIAGVSESIPPAERSDQTLIVAFQSGGFARYSADEMSLALNSGRVKLTDRVKVDGSADDFQSLQQFIDKEKKAERNDSLTGYGCLLVIGVIFLFFVLPRCMS